MPETKEQAERRAKREGFPLSQVTKAKTGGYFIAPHGITKQKAKNAYADCRAAGNNQAVCASVAWEIQRK